MVVVTNGCQDKGENGTHFILVVIPYLRSNKETRYKASSDSKFHTQAIPPIVLPQGQGMIAS